MYCEACGKSTDGGRCRACGRRPARLALNLFALLTGWLAIVGLFVTYSIMYRWADQLFTGLGVSLPLPTRVVAIVGVPFASGVVAVAAAVVWLLLAIILRRTRADKWFATLTVLLLLFQIVALFSISMVMMSLINKLAG